MKSTHNYFFILLTTFLLFFTFIGTLLPCQAQAQTKTITLLLSETKQISKENVISYKSMNTSIATVSDDGLIHAVKTGTTKITSKTNDGKRTYRIIVKKRGMVYTEFSMIKGENLDLQFSQKPDSSIQWRSENPSVAQVNKNGQIRAKKAGTTCISGTSDDHNYMCRLEVTPAIKSSIYLTFDDGPNRYTTPKVLNILKKQKVPATFFELKPASSDFDLTQRVLAEGHSLALHGYQHKYDVIYLSLIHI